MLRLIGIVVALLLHSRLPQVSDLCWSHAPSATHLAQIVFEYPAIEVWRADDPQPYWLGTQPEMLTCNTPDLMEIRVA